MNDQQRVQALSDACRRVGYTEATVRNYTSVLRSFLAFCHGHIATTTQEFVDAYVKRMQWQKRSALTINLHISALRFYFEHVAKQPIKQEEIPYLKRPRSLPEVFSQEEIGRILAAKMNPKHRLLLELVYGCGLRVGEAVTIRVRDVHIDRQLLHVHGKGQKDRLVPIVAIDQMLLTAQMAGMAPDDWLFAGQRPGEYLTRRTAEKILEHACSAAKIVGRWNMHKLRHSYATHLHDGGTDVRYIQALLGHSSVKTTMLYTHLSVQSLIRIQSPLAAVRAQACKTKARSSCG